MHSTEVVMGHILKVVLNLRIMADNHKELSVAQHKQLAPAEHTNPFELGFAAACHRVVL